jgi:hypothetical protein
MRDNWIRVKKKAAQAPPYSKSFYLLRPPRCIAGIHRAGLQAILQGSQTLLGVALRPTIRDDIPRVCFWKRFSIQTPSTWMGTLVATITPTSNDWSTSLLYEEYGFSISNIIQYSRKSSNHQRCK